MHAMCMSDRVASSLLSEVGYAVCICVYSVQWGRGQETFGEDPFLAGALAAAYVRGQQTVSLDPSIAAVAAACKHFAVYNVDTDIPLGGHNRGLRAEFDAIVSRTDLLLSYLPAFQQCTSPDAGGALALMCAYNSINGVPACANTLMNEFLREQWGFQGFIVSDMGAVGQSM
jgi:beta-glucosidase